MGVSPKQERDPQSDTDGSTAAESSAAPSRTSRAWAALTFGLLALVVIVVFALQNLDDVTVRFLGWEGELPLAILLLLVAVLGAVIVFAFGAARIVQLRLQARRSSRSRGKRRS